MPCHCRPLPQVIDVAESLGVARTIPIALRGEVYKITPVIKYPQVTEPVSIFLCVPVCDDLPDQYACARCMLHGACKWLQNTCWLPVAAADERVSFFEHSLSQEGFQGVHFGSLRVVDDAARTLTLRNAGRYEFAYRFAISSAAVQDVMGISPMEGALAPGKEVTITVGGWPGCHF